jgi:hypothetical protein
MAEAQLAVLSELEHAGAALDQLGARWAVVGGLAVSAQTEPRFTRDVDICIAAGTDAEAERIVVQLRQAGYEAISVLEHEPSGRLSAARLRRGAVSAGAVMLDVLFASSGIEAEVVAAASPLEGALGERVRIARIGHLIALKVLARDDRRRPQDAADLRSLIRAASPEELELARTSVRLIAERGFHRQRDLEVLLSRAIADAAD